MANSCAVSLPATQISELITGMLSAFKKVDSSLDRESHFIDPDLRESLVLTLNCISGDLCSSYGQFSRGQALSLAQGAADEVAANAVTDLSTRIDNIIHDAAKYKIPKIVTDMEASNSYQSACTELLICDVMDQVRELKIDDLTNNASQLMLDGVVKFGEVQNKYAQSAALQYSSSKNGYELIDEESVEDNHISARATLEVVLIAVFQAVWLWILQNLYKEERDQQKDTLLEVMDSCASTGDGEEN